MRSGAPPGGFSLGYPSGCGQVVYAEDIFFAIAHPGAENFATIDGVSCSIPEYREVSNEAPIRTPTLVVGAGTAGDAWRDFVRCIDATRPVTARMLFLVNDWYWKDKSKPLQALDALVAVKRKSGVLVDTFTLDDGWDFDWDEQTKIWGQLNRERFPGVWDALQAAGRVRGYGGGMAPAPRRGPRPDVSFSRCPRQRPNCRRTAWGDGSVADRASRTRNCGLRGASRGDLKGPNYDDS
ncbi:MAG: hypothetical protein ACC628_12455 [Pirellulaceae bacterium]